VSPDTVTRRMRS